MTMYKLKTKAEIVQRLLDKKQISAEEAVILLTVEQANTYMPNTVPYPYPNPWFTVYNSTTKNNDEKN